MERPSYRRVRRKYSREKNRESYLSISYRSDGLLGIVLDDGCLVNEHVFFCVISVDEAVTRLDIEPLDSSADFGGNNLLGLLLLLISSLLLYWLVLRVGHDGMVV